MTQEVNKISLVEESGKVLAVTKAGRYVSNVMELDSYTTFFCCY